MACGSERILCQIWKLSKEGSFEEATRHDPLCSSPLVTLPHLLYHLCAVQLLSPHLIHHPGFMEKGQPHCCGDPQLWVPHLS
jgi:hypothetical protein